jgi:hypothetical protein
MAVVFGVRSTLSWVVLPIIAAGAVFCWQRSQIVHLRAQVANQGEALAAISNRMDGAGRVRTARATEVGLSRGAGGPATDARADERRLILDEYRDVLAQMDLPPETASRLQDLLTDRIETVLDAQDAATREGFAEGSAQMARAVGLAIAQVDRDIVGLVGQDGIRRIDGLPPVPQAEPAPAPPVVVSVVVQAPAPQATYAYEADQSAPADTAPYGYYSYLPLYPSAFGENREREHRRPLGIGGFGDSRQHPAGRIFLR